MSNISIIIQREFNERVRKKSFIITTLLMPLLMVALMAAPALIMQFSRGDEKRIAVIDESGLVAPRLESDEEPALRADGPDDRRGPPDADRPFRRALYRRRRTGEPLRREALRQLVVVALGREQHHGPDRTHSRGREAQAVQYRQSPADPRRGEDHRDAPDLPQRQVAGGGDPCAVLHRGHRDGLRPGIHPLHVPSDLRADGHAVGDRGEEQPRAGGHGLLGAALRSDDGQDSRHRLGGRRTGGHLGRADLRHRRRGDAPPHAVRPCRTWASPKARSTPSSR